MRLAAEEGWDLAGEQEMTDLQVQGSAKRLRPGLVNAAGKEAEVVSESSNRIHQTCEKLFSRAL